MLIGFIVFDLITTFNQLHRCLRYFYGGTLTDSANREVLVGHVGGVDVEVMRPG